MVRSPPREYNVGALSIRNTSRTIRSGALVVCVLVLGCPPDTKRSADDSSDDGASPKKKKQSKSATSATAPSSARPPSSQAFRAVDGEVFGRPMLIPAPLAKDVFPGKSYRVDLRNHDGSSRVVGGDLFVTRVDVDLDRDGRWDEKWELGLEGGVMVTRRKVSPNDDERYEWHFRNIDGSQQWLRDVAAAAPPAPSTACRFDANEACSRCVDAHCRAEVSACCGNDKCGRAMANLSVCLKSSAGITAAMVGCWDNFQVTGGLDADPSLRACTTKNEELSDCAKCVVP